MAFLGRVELLDSDPRWITMFDTEKKLLSTTFPIKEFLIEHIGSTSVKDLKAKPVIDILIGTQDLPTDISEIVKHLNGLDYEYIEDYNLKIPERRFFQKGLNNKRTHHIHLVSFHSDFWHKHIFFRDQLRNNSAIRQEYQELKEELAQRHWNSINDYAEAKSEFIMSIDKLRL